MQTSGSISFSIFFLSREVAFTGLLRVVGGILRSVFLCLELLLELSDLSVIENGCTTLLAFLGMGVIFLPMIVKREYYYAQESVVICQNMTSLNSYRNYQL